MQALNSELLELFSSPKGGNPMSDKPKAKHLRVVKTGEDHEQLIKQEDPKPVSTDTISALEQLLEQAKQGNILGFAGVLQMPDDYMSADYVGESVSYQTVGLLDQLKLDILEELRDQDD
jgi:hypothetical protein